MRRSSMFLLLAVVMLTVATPAFAQETAANSNPTNWVAISAGFSMAIAAGMAALGQGKVAAAVAEALARNPGARPGIQLVFFLGMALIESLVLFTLVIIFAKVK